MLKCDHWYECKQLASGKYGLCLAAEENISLFSTAYILQDYLKSLLKFG